MSTSTISSGKVKEECEKEYVKLAERMIKKYERNIKRSKWNSEVWTVDYWKFNSQPKNVNFPRKLASIFPNIFNRYFPSFIFFLYFFIFKFILRNHILKKTSTFYHYDSPKSDIFFKKSKKLIEKCYLLYFLLYKLFQEFIQFHFLYTLIYGKIKYK